MISYWKLQSCPIAATPLRLGRGEGRAYFLTHCSLSPAGGRSQPRRRPKSAPQAAEVSHKESLEHDGTRKSRPAKPSPNPDDAGPIVRRLMGLPVTASCDTAWDRTRVCSDRCAPQNAVIRISYVNISSLLYLSARLSRWVLPCAQPLTIHTVSKAARNPLAQPVPVGQKGYRQREHGSTHYMHTKQDTLIVQRHQAS